MDTIKGIIKKVLKQPESPGGRCFVVAEYEDAATGEMTEVRVGGIFGDLKEKDAFEGTGTWTSSNYRGQKQHIFNAKYTKPSFPDTRNGIKTYLTGIFDYYEHGLRPRDIDELLEKMDKVDVGTAQVIDYLTAHPEVLVHTSIDPDRFEDPIRRTLKYRSASKHATDLMKGAKFDEGSINRVLSVFKTETLETLQGNPYEVMSIPTIGFDKADRLGRTMGVSEADTRRITAALWQHIRKAEAEGSTCVSMSGAFKEIAQSFDISANVVRDVLLEKVRGQDTDKYQAIRFPGVNDMFVMSDWNFRNEVAAANNICRMVAKGRRNDPRKVEQLADKLLTGKPFDEFQRAAVITASTYPISIIDGGPGTGKSTILETVIAISEEIENSEIFLTAPTGKAAQRMEETTGRSATTLQKLLGMREEDAAGQKSFTYNAMNPLPENCVVAVDEFSMADTELFGALMMAMPDSGRVILQGDKDQLQSVGVGRVLADLMEMNVDGKSVIPISRLKNVYRQGKNSKITRDAKQINKGTVPKVSSNLVGGVTFHECKSKDICQFVVNMFRSQLKKSGLDLHRDVGVITPQAPGLGGTWELNQALAEELNPGRTEIPGVNKGKMDDPRMPVPHLGDRIMMTENDHDRGVVTGDVGFVKGHHPDPKTGKTVIELEFDGDRSYELPASKWRNLILSYAITCHKAQGSQFSIVLMPFSDQHTNMTERSLTYTGWTRAKKMVMGIGDKSVFEKAVTNKSPHRYTLLRRLTEQRMIKSKLEPLGEKCDVSASMLPEHDTFASKVRSKEAPKVKSPQRPEPKTKTVAPKKSGRMKLSLNKTRETSEADTKAPSKPPPTSRQAPKKQTGLKLKLKSRARSPDPDTSGYQAPTPG